MTQTILLVEDDDTLRGTVAKFLTRQGFEVVTASDGGSALEQLRSRRFAVTLLDLHLPGLRGTDLLQALRSCSAATRVVVMTGLDRPGARQACLAAGAVAYILKPVQSVELERLLAASPPG